MPQLVKSNFQKLLFNGSPTTLQVGDEILYHETAGTLSVNRNGQGVTNKIYFDKLSHKDDKILVGPASRINIETIIQMIVAVFGLDFRSENTGRSFLVFSII